MPLVACPVEIAWPQTAWHQSLAGAVRDLKTLALRLKIPLSDLSVPQINDAVQDFPILVPQSFLDRMRIADPSDPLLLQVLPQAAETWQVAGFTSDAVGDSHARTVPGMLHKYTGRALLIATGACAIHCRYCFRRHYPYGEEPRRLDDWEPAFAAIAADDSIHEIILSGGDPLMLTDTRLRSLVERLAEIPHLNRLRVHSRLPIVLPDRVTAALVEILKCSRLQPLMVVHANHPAEITGDCAQALRNLVLSGIPTLNQAVLLQGINDQASTLSALSERLVNLGVLPYYLHQLDRVAGAAHFEVAEDVGLSLIATLREQLPGYAVPKYVRETAGEKHKLEVQETP